MKRILLGLLFLCPSVGFGGDVIFWFMGSTETLPVAIYASSGPADSQTIPLALSTTDQNAPETLSIPSTYFYNVPGTQQDWAIWSVARPTTTQVDLLTFEAENGQLSGFNVVSGAISTTQGTGAIARYPFTLDQGGEFTIKALVTGPSPSANSFLLNVDFEPTSPTMIWDIYPPTVTPQWRTIPWRGNATEEAPQYNPKKFTLAPGPHTLIVRGRENGATIDKFTIIGSSFSWQTVNSSITLTIDFNPPGKP